MCSLPLLPPPHALHTPAILSFLVPALPLSHPLAPSHIAPPPTAATTTTTINTTITVVAAAAVATITATSTT